jgi:TP901 family phage tail tape measure protein
MSDANLGRAILEISTRDVDAKAGLNKFKADAEATTKQVQSAFDRLGKSLSTSLNSSVGQLQSSLNRLEGAGKNAAAGLKSIEGGASAAEKATGNLHKTATTAGSGLTNLGKGASDASSGLLRLGSGAIGAAAGGLEKIGSMAVSAGAALTKLGLVGSAALVGMAGVGVKSAGDLQEAVNNISTIKPDIDTSAVFKSLNEISTRVPQSAQQLGDSLYNIFSSISINQQDALSLVEKFAKGAIGAQTDADTWGTAMLGVMNAYGKGIGDVDKIQDTFFNTINAGVVNGKQLASSLGPVTASAKTAGLSIEELGAAIVGVTKEGGDASQNINNLNNYLQKVTTKEAQAAMKDLGVKTVDTQGKFRPFADVLTDLKGKLSTMTQAQRANALQAIFPDAQARQGAIVLMSQLDAVKSSLKDNQSATGSATAAYQKMASGMKAQAALLKNSVIADLTAMGNGMLPAITPGITALAGIFNSQQGNFEKFGKFLGTEITNGITLARDGFLTFKAALSGNWADADKIRPLHALLGNIGLILRNTVIPAIKDFTGDLERNGLSVGKLVETFSPLSIVLSTVRGFMVGGLSGAFDAFSLRVERAGDVLNTLSDALGLGPQFDAIKRVIGPVVDSVMGFVGAIVQVINKSDAIKIAGDIISTAFSGITEVFTFVTKLINDNIGPISDMVRNFGTTVKAALDIAIGAFKLLEGPVSATMSFLSPLLPLIGDLAGAWVSYKGITEGVGLVTKVLNDNSVGLLGTFGKIALVLAPAVAAFEFAAKFIPGFGETLKQLGFIATHTSETIETVKQSLSGINNPLVAQGSAIHDAQGKLIGYANAFETTQQAQERLNNQTKAGLNIFTDASKSYGYTELNLEAINKTMTFAYELSYKYRDALTGQLNVMTKNGSVLQYLLTTHQALAPVVSDQAARMNSLAGALANVNTQSDALSKKLGEINSNMSGVDAGVANLALKVGDATIAYKDQNLTVGEAYNKWKDLTAVQLAGGPASHNAGVEAGKLKDEMVGLVGQGINPLLDAQYKNIGATEQTTAKIADNAVAASDLQGKMNDTAGAVSNANKRLGEWGATSPAPKKAETNFPTVEINISNANKRLGEWNTTPLNPKNAVISGIDAVVNSMKAAVDAINTWNSTPMNAKSTTASVVTIAGGATAPTGQVGAGSAPAPPRPNQPGGPSTKSVGGASTFGLSGALNRDLSSLLGGQGAAAVSAVTQQANQAAFTLGGLQSQIQQIITLFKNLDAKALKAASDQAEQVSKIVSAASGMADLFGKLKDYASVGKTAMTQFSNDSLTMTNLYIAGAGTFKPKALEGAATYVKTSGEVAAAASSMADSLLKVKNWSGPSRDNIRDFTGNVKDLTFDFWDYSQIFKKEMLDGAAAFADTAGKVADATGKAADALAKVRGWSGLARASIAGFSGNVKDLVFDFSEAALIFSEDMYKRANEFADTAGKVSDATSKGADSLKKLLDWVGIARVSIAGFSGNLKDLVFDFSEAGLIFDKDMYARANSFADTSAKVADSTGKGAESLAKLLDWKGIARESISGFTGNLKDITFDFSEAAKSFAPDALTAASNFADAAGKVAETVGSGVEGLMKLSTYISPAGSAITHFVADILNITTQFKDAAGTFKDASGKYAPELLTAAKDFAEAGGTVAESIGKGVEGFTKLATYKGIAPDAITGLEESMHFAVTELNRLTTDVDTAMMNKAKEFGDKVGGFFGAMGDALETFTKLETYKGVAPQAIDGLIESMRVAVAKVGTLKEAADTDLMTKVKAFGESTQQLFDGLKSGMEVFSGLEKYKAIPGDVINGFIQAIVDTINSTGRLAAGVDAGLLTKAQDFAQNITDVFGKLKGGIDTFSSITNFKDDPGKAIDAIIGGINSAIGKMAGADTAANTLYNRVDAWAKKMEDAATRAAQGAQAAANAASIAAGAGGNGSPGATISNFNPIGAGAGGTNLFSTGQSMGNAITSGIKSSLQIQSPSKVMAGIGSNIALGLAAGIKSSAAAPQLTLADLIDKMLKGTLLTTKQLTDASQQMDLFSKLGAVFQSYNAAVNALNTTAAVVPARLGIFMATMDTLTTTFASFKTRYGYPLMHAAEEVAGSFNSVAGTIVNGVTSLNALRDYKQIPADTITVFVNDLYNVASNFVIQSKKVNTDMLSSMSLISETFGKVAGAIGPAVASITSLKDYTSPAKKSFTDFESDMGLLVADFTAMGARFEPAAIAAAATWGDGVGKLFSGLNNTFQVFDGISKFKGVDQGQVQLLSNQVDMVTKMVEKLSGSADMKALDQAADYAAGIDKIYSNFNNVFEFYNNLDHLHSSPVDLITGFLNAFKAVGNFNWQPSTGPAISALSSGGSVPQLSAGISMQVPGATSSNQKTGPDTYILQFPNVTVITKADVQDIAEAVVEKQMEKLRN